MRTSRQARFALAGTIVLVALGVAAPADAGSPAAAGLRALMGVSCPTTSDCLAVGSADTGAPVVVATSDAGATWTVTPTPPGAETLGAVECWSAERCLVGGSGFGDAGALYRTLDGGLTWHVTPAVVPGGFFLSISCHTAAFCVAGGPFGYIFRSLDAGRTWDEQRLTNASMTNALDCITTTVCQGVGWSGGAFWGVSLRTKDAGLTWRVTGIQHTLAFPTGVSCTSVDTCVLVAQDTVNGGSRQVARTGKSHNGGKNWTRHDVPGGYTTAEAVDCPSADVCEAGTLGRTGMLGSTDGGRTWHGQGPSISFVRGMSCPTRSTCVAVGETRFGGASIHRTTDGGATWVRQPIG